MTSQPPAPRQFKTINHQPLSESLADRLERDYGNDATPANLFRALAQVLRDRALSTHAQSLYNHRQDKAVHYLSMEFLIGRLLRNTVLNMGLAEEVDDALAAYGVVLSDIEDFEQDAGLGNGGLGRLAACFLDSCASLDLPVTGYGLRYQYGMFSQVIHAGAQWEKPDPWLSDGYVWESRRHIQPRTVSFYGHCIRVPDSDGRQHVSVVDTEDVLAIPYDVPVPGYANDRVNALRLWSAESATGLDLAAFNAGNHSGAVAGNNHAEAISMVLYPGDETDSGQRLRLRQQYFLCSATLQDILARWTRDHGDNFGEFSARNLFQLNDTHPVCAIPELMRLLMDIYLLEWDEAWEITRSSMAYTNHTLLPEALEEWSASLVEHLLPRIFDIIREIDRRFQQELLRTYPDDPARHARMAIISDGDHPKVRMAFLGIVGSRAINGVAALHSQLLKQTLFKDFHEFKPAAFNNKTNGVTHRRWLQSCNPELTTLICDSIGDKWIRQPLALTALAPFADDSAFRMRWERIRQTKKQQLAEMLRQHTGVELDTCSLLDVQVKRIHEYKRQLLNILHVVHLHQTLRAGGSIGPARTVLMAGKAAPGYAVAKMIIKLANDVADHINRDALTQHQLRFVFLANYGVSAMEKICPAADLSSQISTAGKEASGTGNMKFMLNGALTIGTMDGANIEILESVGEDHFFRFGLTTAEVTELRPHYSPDAFVENSPNFQRVLSALRSGAYATDNMNAANLLIDGMLQMSDPWMTAADFDSFIASQEKVGLAFQARDTWLRSSILNTAAAGRFSSDRTIRDYAKDIWHLKLN